MQRHGLWIAATNSAGLASRFRHGCEARHARCVRFHLLAIQRQHAGCRREAKAEQQEPGEALKAERGPCVEGGANRQIAYDGAAALDEIVEAEIRPQQPIAAEDRDQAEGKGLATIVPSERSMALANTGLKLMAPITTACRVVVSPRASVECVDGQECPGGEQRQKGSCHQRQTHGDGLERATMRLQVGGDSAPAS